MNSYTQSGMTMTAAEDDGGDIHANMLWAIILGMVVLHSTYCYRCSCNSRCSVFLRGDVGYVSVALQAIL